MMRTKNLLALVLALLLAFGCYSAVAEDEPMTISFVSWNCGEIEDDNYVEAYLEEKFNVELITSRVDLSNTTQKELMLASGEMPECGWQMGSAYDMFYVDELTRTIPMDMIREYAPMYAAEIDKNPMGWKLFVDNKSGEHYAMTGIVSNVNAFMLAVRLDWMENLGMDLPDDMVQLDDAGRLFVSPTALDTDEFRELLRAFTEDDPDGNGIDDTYGYSAGGRDSFFWTVLESGFGFTERGNYNTAIVDGEVEMWYTTEEYKAFLEYMADIYANGWLDQEFATIDRQTSWEKFGTSKVGVMGTMAAWASFKPTFATRPPMNIASAADEGKILLLPSLTNVEGTTKSPAYTATMYNYAFTVRKDVSDEKLAKMLEILDWVSFDEFGREFCRYGIEGEHFDFEDSETKVGVMLREGVQFGREWGFSVYNPNYINYMATVNYEASSMFNKLCEVFLFDYMKEQMTPTPSDYMSVVDWTAYEYNSASINTIVEEYFYNVISGKKDLDETWDAYLNDLNGAGYPVLHEALQLYQTWEEYNG